MFIGVTEHIPIHGSEKTVSKTTVFMIDCKQYA